MATIIVQHLLPPFFLTRYIIQHRSGSRLPCSRLVISCYLFFLSGVVLPMVLRRGGARLLRRPRPGQRRLNPLCAEVIVRIRDLGWQAAYSGRLQGAIRRGRGPLRRRDCARAEGKASAPFAHIGKSRLGTDGRCSLARRFPACLLFVQGKVLNLKIA